MANEAKSAAELAREERKARIGKAGDAMAEKREKKANQSKRQKRLKWIIPTVVMLVCWCAVRVLVFTTIGQVYHDIRLTCWIYPITWGLSSVVYIIFLKTIKKKGVF